MTKRRVVIVGGGITGLAAAHALEKHDDVEVTLLEASERLGGTIRSEKHGACVLDVGADGWVASKTHATALAKAVGLGDSLIETDPENRGLYLGWGGRLRRMPEGLVLGVPSHWRPVLGSDLFSARGKARMMLEPYIPAKAGTDDESIQSFVTRRLGSELAERVGVPLLGGIVSGDAAELSIRATFPQLVEAERTDGSLVKSARRKARENPRRAGAIGPSPFRSLTGGVESLVAAVARALVKTNIRTKAPVVSIARDAASYAITLREGETLFADAILVACPFGVASKLLSPISSALSRAFAPLRETRSAAYLLTYRRADVQMLLRGTGFLVPKGLGRPVVAATWLSQKWKGRAPDDVVIVRAFLRGELADRPAEELLDLVHEDLRAWMSITEEPQSWTFQSWTRPYLQVGHLERIETLRRALAAEPHLYIGGSGYAGVGIPDAIAQGQAAAASIVAT